VTLRRQAGLVLLIVPFCGPLLVAAHCGTVQPRALPEIAPVAPPSSRGW
jgi:hypothetical protein